jgi:hypothetical protein
METGSIGPAFWLVMTLGGAALLGLALAWGVISTHRRQQSATAQRMSDAATSGLYRAEEQRRVHEEGDDGDVHTPAGQAISTTKARQGVAHNRMNLVLHASLILAVICAVGLAYYWMQLAGRG